MPQISRRTLKPEKLEKIYTLFFDLLITTDDQKKAQGMVEEILTPTEKIMIAKRIACFYLLLQNVPGKDISIILKYSLGTVSYWKRVLDDSVYIQLFLKSHLNEKHLKQFFKDIFVELMYGGLRKGSNWSYDKESYFVYQRKRKDPF